MRSYDDGSKGARSILLVYEIFSDCIALRLFYCYFKESVEGSGLEIPFVCFDLILLLGVARVGLDDYYEMDWFGFLRASWLT